MNPTSEDKESRRAAQRRADLEKLRGIEQHAVQCGRKLGSRDRLKAAYHLRRAWEQANQYGVRKEDFQDAVRDRLKRSQGKRAEPPEFRLNSWTLRRGEDPTTQPHLFDVYATSPTPQKELEPYLVGLTVAAEGCGADPDDWKLDMLRDLKIWSDDAKAPDVAPTDDRPFETLEILLKSLCVELAKRNRLEETFKAVRALSCRWEMFAERLVVTDERCMDTDESTFTPTCNTDVYFEEMFPLPSVPLLRVPYFVATAEFLLAPEETLRAQDDARLASGDYLTVGTSTKVDGAMHYCIPADAPGCRLESGTLLWFREIRLCIVMDGRGGFSSSLETRPRAQVRFGADLPFGGTHHVVGGYELDLERGLFYARTDLGGHVWPHIRAPDGKEWRITLPKGADGSLPFREWTERDPETSGWWFDPDPVTQPGELGLEPWNLSYTPATASYLRHWLAADWRLGTEAAECPWQRDNFDRNNPDSPWNRYLPPVHGLNFPDFSHATWIECCLHNDLIEEALQASIDRLKEQTGRIQADWLAARERHANALRRRWKDKTDNMETKG